MGLNEGLPRKYFRTVPRQRAGGRRGDAGAGGAPWRSGGRAGPGLAVVASQEQARGTAWLRNLRMGGKFAESDRTETGRGHRRKTDTEVTMGKMVEASVMEMRMSEKRGKVSEFV